ncbi:hypothetical protein CDL15_Pgr009524 [Punica granatum]|uniref:Uncharacterized protein n=1 Tax=Punica granatum TaxID=22663 RepID=A0A218WU27_PUNGR|nr:hypothetical protein CDL15_Pgr009524 [Punica granatum]PKI52727.1 hypothetical protein CRG98_026878 [Punica granatum]
MWINYMESQTTVASLKNRNFMELRLANVDYEVEVADVDVFYDAAKENGVEIRADAGASTPSKAILLSISKNEDPYLKSH